MSDLEITTLFANLLDNAIESCDSSMEQKKEIYLRIHKFKDYVILKLKNTYSVEPIDNAGNLLSTKPGHLGIGMLISEDLANKYNGNLTYDYSEFYFITKIILSTSK